MPVSNVTNKFRVNPSLTFGKIRFIKLEVENCVFNMISSLMILPVEIT